jgi:hypothetical protein
MERANEEFERLQVLQQHALQALSAAVSVACLRLDSAGCIQAEQKYQSREPGLKAAKEHADVELKQVPR